MNMQIYYRIKKIVFNTLIHLFLISVAFSCLFPLFWMFFSSLKTQENIFIDLSIIPSRWHWENYSLAWKEAGFARYFLNSIIYTLLAVSGIVVVSSLAAYAFSRLKFRASRILFIIFIAAMMIPIPGNFVALYVLLNKLHLRNTPLGYLLALINTGLSVSIFLLKTFFDKLPRELEDAAKIDGLSHFGIFRHVALPLAKPILAVVVVFNALVVWNEYILALIIFDARQFMPIQVAIKLFQGEFVTNYPLLMTGLSIATLPIILLYLFLQKYVVRSVTSTLAIE